MDPELELSLFRFLERMRSTLRSSRDPRQAVRSALRQAMAFLEADSGGFAVKRPGRPLEVRFRIPREETAVDEELLARAFAGDWPELPASTLLTSVPRRGRPYGLMLLERAAGFPQGHGRALTRIAVALSEILQDIDQDRAREIRLRIDQKIVEEIRGKDVFYQILHGLRSLTNYDHSSTLFIPSGDAESLVLEAEQITWMKAKSERIATRLPIDDEIRGLLRIGDVFGFERTDAGWVEWTEHGATAIAELLDRAGDAVSAPDAPPEGSMLCAALAPRDGVLGLVRIASKHPGSLGAWEADLVRRLLPQISVAIRNSRRAESLQANLVAAERRSAMADLARSVAHDVNNALGAVFPLVQQIRSDLSDESVEVDREELYADMEQIEQSVSVCQRIFGGMLAFARGAKRAVGSARVEDAIRSPLTILGAGLSRRRIHCDVEIDEDLPRVAAPQTHLEQTFLNLFANARDAMQGGGTLRVRARRGVEASEGMIEVTVEDTGAGIEPDDLPRIQEPFFTTKQKGSGLGLSIVRNLIWEMRGKIHFGSRPGQGTRVEVLLPAVGDDSHGPPAALEDETEDAG